MWNNSRSFFSKVLSFLAWPFVQLGKLIALFPFFSFLAGLALLVGLIVAGNTFKKPPTPPTAEARDPKLVEVFSIGEYPELKVQAKVEKSGVIKLVAQTPGVVQKIKVQEGDRVKRGHSMFTLSTNYQGGNIPSLTRQISQKNYKFLEENYQSQIDSINISRDIARKNENQARELRAIGRQSLSETRSLISLNEEILSGLDKQLKQLELINVNGASDSAILQIKQAKSGTQAALNGLKTSLRNNEYMFSDDKEPAKIAELMRDQTLKQLDLQEKTLALNKDISKLNLRISQINESLMYPGSPCPGIVERIYVKPGQVVSPGTLLATITSDHNSATAVAMVSPQVARSVSSLEPSFININGEELAIYPRHISEEATDGALHSIFFTLPDEYTMEVSNDSYVSVTIPIGIGVSYQTQDPFVPLDAIYHSQDRAFVYVVDEADTQHLKVKSQEVELGTVFGNYVEVKSGLEDQYRVILNRNVIEGEEIKIATELAQS